MKPTTTASFTYESQALPPTYCCSRCRVPGLKLWRQYNTFLSHLQLVCAGCIDPAVKVGRDGMHTDRYGQRSDQMTDRIGTTGSLVPAVPTEQADTFWGYSSVPIAGVAWWRALPTYKGQELEPFRISPEEAERDRLYEERKRASVKQSIRLRAEWRSEAMYVPDFDEKYLHARYLEHHRKSARAGKLRETICDDSGTLPAKKAVPVVRCTACGRRAKCARMADGTTYRPFAWVFPEEKRPLAGLCGGCR